MYSASNAFHQAVANGAHQIALLIFEDAVFTNDDISIERGIELDDYFNTDEDLSIGKALSNELSFTLFNDNQLLNDYEFGDFLATIGAQINDVTVTANGTCQVQSASHTYVGYSRGVLLKRDGVAMSPQPTSAVVSLLVYNGLVYVGLADGNVKVYKDYNGAEESVTVNAFMKAQLNKWNGKGAYYVNRMLTLWQGTHKKTYEFVPLGYFTAERPNVPTKIEIDFTCHDYMLKLDKDIPKNLNFPMTIGNLFAAVCNAAGVQYRTSVFMNSTATITKKPDEFDNATMRDVMQWIAEAAGSIARFDRDGYLIMDWIRSTELVIDESGYSEFNPYWYETKQITKLYNRESNGNSERTVGNGDEGYLIQDNPLLKGVS